MVEAAAAAHGLPFEFFARVIWQESRFRSDAVGPVTRNGWQLKHAQAKATLRGRLRTLVRFTPDSDN
jgi:soluble lytic murein transglycosylase-like protein